MDLEPPGVEPIGKGARSAHSRPVCPTAGATVTGPAPTGIMGPMRTETADQITWDDFAKVDIRVGRVVEVAEFPEARRPAWKLRIDFGPDIGLKRSSAQITNYSREELEGRLVLAVVNFPPRQIGPYMSEVLTLGTYREDTVLLVDPSVGALPGDRLG